MTHILKKLKGRDYSSHCRDCHFSECGNNYNTILRAKKHAVIENHSVEYYVESGRVYKVLSKSE